MDWLNKLNLAIDYIEEHLDSDIDYKMAASIACCSLSGFQKMFLFATDTTISEYIRQRRMASAACELVNGTDQIINIAIKYGYNSPAAFSRAFRSIYSLTPTAIRKAGNYKDYPRIRLSIHFDGGNMYMSEKPLVRIEEHGTERVISFYVDCTDPEKSAWSMLQKWCVVNLSDYTARRYIGCAPKGHHPDGSQHVNAEEEIRHEYMAQMLLVQDEGKNETFKGAEVCDAPKGLFLVGDVALNEFDENGMLDIGASMMKSFQVMQDFIEKTETYAFELDKRPYHEEHVFSEKWFRNGGAPDGFKLWLPIKRII